MRKNYAKQAKQPHDIFWRVVQTSVMINKVGCGDSQVRLGLLVCRGNQLNLRSHKNEIPYSETLNFIHLPVLSQAYWR